MPFDAKRKVEDDSGNELRARAASMAKHGEVADEWRAETERREAEAKVIREQQEKEELEATLDLLSEEGNVNSEVRRGFSVFVFFPC